jgi:putative membrane protein
MSLLTALVPAADWSGPAWWVVFFPIGWFVFFCTLFFVFRRFGPSGYACGRHHGRRGWGGPVDPLGVLDRRFAEGEIDADEYRTRRTTLEQSRP